MEKLEQLIENFYLDFDEITGVYQNDAREKTNKEIKTLDDWKKYLDNSYNYWSNEGNKWNHYFYFQLSSIAKNHLDILKITK